MSWHLFILKIIRNVMSDFQWVESLKLPFLSSKAAIQRDPQTYARKIAKVLPINDYLPLG